MIRPMCRPIIRPLVRGIQTGDTNPPYGINVFFGTAMTALPSVLVKAGATYTRNSLKTVYQGGSLVTLAANQFGTTYDAVTGLHAFEAEPAATNLALNSAGAAATWTVSNVVDAVTPITGFAASLAFGNNSVQRSATKPISVTSAATYSISIFLEMDDASAPVIGATNATGDVSITLNGVIATANLLVKRIGTGNLYRISGSIVASATASHAAGFTKYVGQSAKSFRVVGIQVETGSRATSYISTAGSTVTRAADVLSTATANLPGFNAAGYTLVGSCRMDVLPTLANYICSITDGTSNNRAALARQPTTAANVVSSGGSTVANQTVSTTILTQSKLASSFLVNNFLFSHNGVDAVSDTSGAMPVAPTTMHIGSLNGTNQLNGYIYGFKLIPVALNQAQTTAQTS